jgi:hypothetical protein
LGDLLCAVFSDSIACWLATRKFAGKTEITARKSFRTRWISDVASTPVDYWLVISGDESTPGINGGLMKSGGPFSGTINTVEVDDIDAILAKVKARGGQIVFEKDAFPGVGYLAYFKDNAGVIVGVLQPDTKAGLGG